MYIVVVESILTRFSVVACIQLVKPTLPILGMFYEQTTFKAII